jgi:hypothetical protein
MGNITLRLDEELIEKIKEIARREGTTPSEIYRKHIVSGIKGEGASLGPDYPIGERSVFMGTVETLRTDITGLVGAVEKMTLAVENQGAVYIRELFILKSAVRALLAETAVNKAALRAIVSAKGASHWDDVIQKAGEVGKVQWDVVSRAAEDELARFWRGEEV